MINPKKGCVGQEYFMLCSVIDLQNGVPKQGTETAYPEHGVHASVQYPQKGLFREQLPKDTSVWLFAVGC